MTIHPSLHPNQQCRLYLNGMEKKLNLCLRKKVSQRLRVCPPFPPVQLRCFVSFYVQLCFFPCPLAEAVLQDIHEGAEEPFVEVEFDLEDVMPLVRWHDDYAYKVR